MLTFAYKEIKYDIAQRRCYLPDATTQEVHVDWCFHATAAQEWELGAEWRSQCIIGLIMYDDEGKPKPGTAVDVSEQRADGCPERLQPHSARKYQQRMHMASLGSPIINDTFYPIALPSIRPPGSGPY